MKALVVVVSAFIVFCASGSTMFTAAADGKATIVKRYGRGFLETKTSGLKVLHLKGTAYERGYQRGMLQEDLGRVESNNITELMAYFGGDDPEAGLKALLDAKKEMEPFIPYQFRNEIRGMADALADRKSLINYDDILLHLVGADFGMMDSGHDLTKSPKRNTYPLVRGCSDFSAWGNATKDGQLIMAANSDYYDTEEELISRPIVIVDPTDGGYGYVGVLWDVFPVAAGMNEAGIAINGHLSYADEESLRGVSSELILALILQYADSLEDAIEVATTYPRTCGIIIHVADAKTNRAAVIEYTADHISVRLSEPGRNILWATNHFNAFPGWQGYHGFNMPSTQVKRLKLADITTIKRWQDSLAKVGRGPAGRYGRFQKLLNKNYGRITVDKAQEIISDRYSFKQGRTLSPTEASADWDDWPISCVFHDWVMSKKITYYKNSRSGELVVKQGNVGSFVARPSTGDIWWAVGLPPSAYTSGYHHLNLHKELAKNR